MKNQCTNIADCSPNPNLFLRRTNHIVNKRELVSADELELQDGRTFVRDYIPLFSNGLYKGHLWSYTDITLQKNYRRNLEIQKEKYGSIIANMNLGLVEEDNDGTNFTGKPEFLWNERLYVPRTYGPLFG